MVIFEVRERRRRLEGRLCVRGCGCLEKGCWRVLRRRAQQAGLDGCKTGMVVEATENWPRLEGTLLGHVTGSSEGACTEECRKGREGAGAASKNQRKTKRKPATISNIKQEENCRQSH